MHVCRLLSACAALFRIRSRPLLRIRPNLRERCPVEARRKVRSRQVYVLKESVGVGLIGAQGRPDGRSQVGGCFNEVGMVRRSGKIKLNGSIGQHRNVGNVGNVKGS